MTHFLMLFKKIRAAASLGLLAGLTLMPVARAQNGTPQATNWQPWGQPITYTLASKSGQTTVTNVSVSKAPATNDGLDWYLVAGPINLSTTANSGWTGTAMDLDILGQTAYPVGQNATLYDAQPVSTTFTDQKTLSIGVNLGAGSSIGLSYSSSLTSTGGVTVGTTNAGNEANFHFQYSTTSSITMQYAAVFNVRHGQGLFLDITPNSWWDPPSGSTTNQNGMGLVVADFGAAPAQDAGGRIIQAAMGPQISPLAQSNECMTAELETQAVTLTPCNSDLSQRWYYTGSGQIVNVKTGFCLDIDQGDQLGQGGLPNPNTTYSLVADACATGIQYSQYWQITNTPVTGVGLVIQGLGNYVVSVNSVNAKEQLVLAAPPTQYLANESFFLH